MDTDNYENPFASSDKEIGQMDVQIDDESILRESIRTILLEVNDFQCNAHSLGWISPDGEFIDLENHGNHDDWMIKHIMKNKLQDKIPLDSSPPRWIKVSRADQLFFNAASWKEVTEEQINALIEMWDACSKYSRWVQNESETHKVLFGRVDWSPRPDAWMTIPDFLSKHGGRNSIDNFYGMLLGEL